MNGAACRYKVLFPAEANHYDKIHLDVKKLTNARIFAISTLRYSSKNYTETLASEGDKITLEYPNTLLLTIQSTNKTHPGNFSLSYHLEKFVPLKFYQTQNFQYLIGGVLLAALLVIFLLVILCWTLCNKRQLEKKLLQRTTPI